MQNATSLLDNVIANSAASDEIEDQDVITSWSNVRQGKSQLIKFFLNQIPLVCPGDSVDKIDQILRNWRGNYHLLESHQGYIQWLFPIKVIGVNSYAPTITIQDIEFIRESSEIQNRFLSCFDLMLDFYGFER
jgi:hypothetical protein